MATIDPQAASPSPIPPDSVTFTADVDLNLSWRHRGYGVEIVRDKRAGVALPAGEEFSIPAHLSDEFERQFGPRPNDASVTEGGRIDGLIPGLRRVQS